MREEIRVGEVRERVIAALAPLRGEGVSKIMGEGGGRGTNMEWPIRQGSLRSCCLIKSPTSAAMAV